MSIAPQLLVFPSRMFLASLHIHKCHFQISFLQRKVSQPRKLKKSGTSFRPYSNATHQHCLCSMKDGMYLLFAFKQMLTSWREAFCWYKSPSHFSGACETTTTPSSIIPFRDLTEAQQPVLNKTQCKCPVLLFKIITSKLCIGKSRNAFLFCWLFTLRGHTEQ